MVKYYVVNRAFIGLVHFTTTEPSRKRHADREEEELERFVLTDEQAAWSLKDLTQAHEFGMLTPYVAPAPAPRILTTT